MSFEPAEPSEVQSLLAQPSTKDTQKSQDSATKAAHGLPDDKARLYAGFSCCVALMAVHMVSASFASMYTRQNLAEPRIETGAFFACFHLTAFAFCSSVAGLMASYSRRNVAIGGGATFVVATLGLALSTTNFLVVVGFRLLQGIGLTILQVSAYAICSSLFPEHIGLMLGYVHGFMGVGFLLGPAAGGALFGWLGWEGALLVLSGLAAVPVLALLAYLNPEGDSTVVATSPGGQRREENPAEAAGGAQKEAEEANPTIYFCSSLLALRVEMQWPLMAMLATTAVVGLMEVRFEQRDRSAALIDHCVCVLQAMLPYHLEQKFKYNSSEVGGLLALAVFAALMSSVVVGLLSDRLDGHTVMSFGLVLVSVGACLLFVETAYGVIMGMAFVGLGAAGVVIPALPVLKAAQQDSSVAGENRISGLYYMTILLGLGLGALVSSTLGSIMSLYTTGRTLALVAALVGFPGYLYSAGFHKGFKTKLPSFFIAPVATEVSVPVGSPRMRPADRPGSRLARGERVWNRSIMVASNGEPFYVYHLRWVLLFGVAASSFVSGMIMMSLASIARPVAAYYDVSSAWIDFLAVLFSVSPLFLYFPAMWLCDKVGISSCIILGSTFQVVGLMVRLMALGGGGGVDSYFFLFAGTLLAAMGSPFISDVPAALAQRWFPETERTTAMSLGAIARFSGTGVGMMIGSPWSEKGLVVQLAWILGYQALTGVIIGAVCLATFEDEPPEPPGLVAAEKTKAPEQEEYSLTVAFMSVLGEYAVLLTFIPVAVATASVNMMLLSIDRIGIAEGKVSSIGLFFLFGVVSAVGISVSNVMKDRLNTLLSRLMGLCALSFILMAAGRMVGIAPMVATGMVLSTVAGYLDLMVCLLSSALFVATDAPLTKYPVAQMFAYAALIGVMLVLTAYVPDKAENQALKTRKVGEGATALAQAGGYQTFCMPAARKDDEATLSDDGLESDGLTQDDISELYSSIHADPMLARAANGTPF